MKKMNLILGVLSTVCIFNLQASDLNYCNNQNKNDYPYNGTHSINLDKVNCEYKASNLVRVATIDTGIDIDNHKFNKIIEKNANMEKKYCKFISCSNFPYYDFSLHNNFSAKAKKILQIEDAERDIYDHHGHGTHIAGLIASDEYSMGANVKILPLKFYNPNATGDENLDSSLKALRYAISQNVEIINYSGGGPERSESEYQLLKLAEKKGILIVAAAGNEGSNLNIAKNAYYPCSYNLSNVICVASIDKHGDIVDSSNYGNKFANILAPGDHIKSTLQNGRSGYLTGTSQATAIVSGVMAYLKSYNPSLKATEIKKIVQLTANRKNPLYKNYVSSGGVLDVKSLFEYVKEEMRKREIASKAK